VVQAAAPAVRLQQQIQEHKVEEEAEHHHLVLLQLRLSRVLHMLEQQQHVDKVVVDRVVIRQQQLMVCN
jgi:hypothetical protein